VSLLLHIDSAVAGASICLSRGTEVLGFAENPVVRDSAAWLQLAIRDLCREHAVSLSQLDAVSVSNGPGSYTGLRVGLASAKGLCYALNIPLITLSTLQVMAAAAAFQGQGKLCPMIDARRMEVFAALYDEQLRELLPAHNYILDENSFLDELEQGPVHFFGNGSDKFRSVQQHANAIFLDVKTSASDGIQLALTAYEAGNFANLAYAEPDYGKEFYTPVPPKIE
jgi:tRNA threonylcarbamoyladenosine biosynthesis protein TsaB